MQTVSADYLTAVVSPVRTPITEVEIALVDNETLGASISVTADQKAALHAKENAIDAIKTVPRRFALAATRCTPGADLYPCSSRAGWWGNTLSDANGDISGGESIELDYGGAVAVKTVGWWADTYLGRPVNWVVEWYDGADWNEIGNETGDTAESWQYEFDSITNIYKLRMTITKVNHAYSYAKLIELEAGLTVDVTDRVDSWEVLKEREHEAETLPIGNTSVNSLDLYLKNTDGVWFRKSGSLYAPYLVANRKITVRSGFLLADGTRELLDQGVFYSVGWYAEEGDTVAHVAAWDRAKRLQEDKYSTSTVLANYTISELVIHLADAFGLDTGDQIISATSDEIAYAWFTDASYWYHLRNLAAGDGGTLYFDEQNRLVFENRSYLAGKTTSVATISDLNALMGVKEGWEQTKMRNHIVVPVRPLTPATSGNIYQYTETITVPAGGTESIRVIFAESPCINVGTPSLTGGAHISVQSWTAYAWGGSLVLANSGGSDEDVTQIDITGQVLRELGGVRESAVNTVSEGLNGTRTYTVPDGAAQYIQRRAIAQSLAEDLMDALSDPGAEISVAMRGRPELQLADRLTVQDTKLGINGDYWLTRARLFFNGVKLSMEATLLEVV